MFKRFVVAVIILVLLCGGLIGFNIFRDRAIEEFFANMQPPAVTISASEVETVAWQPGIEAYGTVNALRGVEISAETGGVVDDILFTANQSVEQGDLLVQIEDAVEQADLAAARVSVESDEQELARVQALSQRGVSSAATLEDAQSALAVSRSQIVRLQAVLDQKAIEAPFSGVIGIPRIEVGQYVTPGTPIATLQNFEAMRVDFSVPEQDIDSLEIGQPIHVGVSADDLRFSGEIIGIDPKIDPISRLVSVRAEVQNPDGELVPGQFVRVEVELPEEEGVVALPQTAVVTSLYGDYVYVVVPREKSEEATPSEAEEAGVVASGSEEAAPETEAGLNEAEAAETVSVQETEAMRSSETTETDEASEVSEAAETDDAPALEARQVFVTTGRRSGDMVEIVEGLEPGQRVVTAGQNKLSNGISVTVDNTIDPAQLARLEEPRG